MVKTAAEESKKAENSDAKKAAPAAVPQKKKFTVNANGKKVPAAGTIAKPPSPPKPVPATAAAKAAASTVKTV